MPSYRELDHKSLKKYWNEREFDFDTTAALGPFDGIIGQDRAAKAMDFGVRMKSGSYNIYMSGAAGTGKTSYAQAFVNKIAKDQPVADDWCYVYNFDDPGQPVAINLSPGIGRQFCTDMDEFIEVLQVEIPKAFSGEEYENERAALYKEFQSRRSDLMTELQQKAKDQGFELKLSNSGMYFLPVVDGTVLDEEQYAKLEGQLKKEVNKKLNDLQLEAVEIMRRTRDLEKEIKNRIKDLDNKIALFAVGLHMNELKEKYLQNGKIQKYLDGIKKDILMNIDDFKEQEDSEEKRVILPLLKRNAHNHFEKYKVNLLIDNSDLEGAPVVVEHNPTFQNLLGKIEYENELGAMVTNYMMIKPGSLHKANGGYLIVQAKDVLGNLQSWEAIKRVLKTKKISIESLREQLGLVAVSGLKPQSIPIDVKVIMVGNDFLYRLLYNYDEEFKKLFKIKVDFDDEMENTRENALKIGKFIGQFCRREGIRHFDKTGFISVLDYSSRLVEHQNKLTTRFNDIVEILWEANTWAEIDDSSIVTGCHVKKAVAEKEYRSNRYDQKLLKLMEDHTIMIDTQGAKVGQVNGLSIIDVGDYVFGKPTRITAATYMGRSGIINIEREVDMSGTSHSKGVLILSGYIGQKYAQDIPLALTASICFEQLYSGIDGDSASSTELYAILSSLADLPINQGIAVTGSVNQKGEIQAVGGVTRKIEGFFTLCRLRGLTGYQGVIIPHNNIKNLVLSEDVIDAVRKKKFHIYPIKTIDEGMEILTGVAAGEKDRQGKYPSGTVNDRVYKKLEYYARTMVNFAKEEK